MQSTRQRKRSHFLDGGAQPDPCPSLPIELGPQGLGVGSWVPGDKHRLLAEYLFATRRAWASSAWPQRVLIDPFCAAGRIQVQGEPFTRDGGAAVAWRESVEGGFPFTHVLVGDLDGERARACAARLQALGAPVECFEGPASKTVPQMVSQVPRDALCMAYVDPYNLELLTFDLFEQLARLRVDIAAHFSVMDLTRNVEAEFDPLRNRFEGTAPGWSIHPPILAASKRNVALQFFQYWQAKVQELGFTCSTEKPLVRNNDNAPLYRLVFFAKHQLPLRVWGDVARGGDKQMGLDL